MLSSINPLGERTRGQRFWVTVSWYVAGSAVGGIILGGLGGILGSWLPAGNWRLVAVIPVCLVGAVLDLAGKPPPSIHRQVDENWLSRYRGWVYGLGFGLQLGFGIVTIVTTASVYTLVAVAVLVGSPLMGAMVGGVFGMARAVAIIRVSRAYDPGSLRNALRRLQPRVVSATRFAVGAQLLIGVIAAGLVIL